eukprot:m.269689 g.269689  ORF g.269689 m.269689 type:complete len:60 (-) comp19304_c4_seq4:3066-3245(-)
MAGPKNSKANDTPLTHTHTHIQRDTFQRVQFVMLEVEPATALNVAAHTRMACVDGMIKW